MAKRKADKDKELLKAPDEKNTLDEKTYEEEQEDNEKNESKIKEENDKLTLVNDILTFHVNNLPWFQGVWERAKKLINLIFFEHWDDVEKAKHEDQGRQAFNIPMMFSKAMSMMGFEKQSRKFLPYEPEGEEDELLAEIFNVIKKRIEKTSKYFYNASMLFFDMCFACWGIEKVEEYENDMGVKELRKVIVPYNQCIWDKSNVVKRDMTDCWRFQEFEWKYLNDLKFTYGEDHCDWNSIEENFNKGESVPLENADMFVRNDVNEVEIKKGKAEQTRNPQVKVIHDQKLQIMDAHYLHDIKSGNVECYYDKSDGKNVLEQRIKEASQKISELKKQAEQNPSLILLSKEAGIDLTKEFDPDDYYILKTKRVKRVRYTVIAGNIILEEPEILEEECINHTVYYSLFFHGTTTTPGAVGQDLQVIVDRFFSNWDKSLGIDTKGNSEINTAVLDENYNTPEEASDALRAGDDIFVKGQGSAVSAIERKGANPQVFSTIGSIKEITEDTYGGKTFQGLSEGANQSGRAVMALQQGGVNMNLNYLDAFDFHRTITDEKLIKKIKKIYRGKLSLEVMGRDLTEKMKATLEKKKLYKDSLVKEGSGWLNVDEGMDFNGKKLWEASLSVGVSMTGNSMDEREAKRKKLREWSADTGVPIPARLAGRYIGLDATEISELETAEQEHQKGIAEQRALQIEQAKNKAGIDTMKALGNTINNSGGAPPVAAV